MILAAALLLLACAYVLFRVRNRRNKRAALLASRLTEEERAIVYETVPLFARMPQDLRERAEGRMALFLDQVDFYGCDGLEVTDEMTLSIAAQAALLVAGNDAWYPTLRTVLLYPGAFVSERDAQDGYVVTRGQSVRIGESWARGPVILSWADSERGAFVSDDGHNVVLHEFAHQLDDASGATNGMPVMADAAAAEAWAQAFNEAYARAGKLLSIGKRPFLDPYGATAPEELFAVATEAFFETPQELRAAEPDVYAQLKAYYRQDPAMWSFGREG